MPSPCHRLLVFSNCRQTTVNVQATAVRIYDQRCCPPSSNENRLNCRKIQPETRKSLRMPTAPLFDNPSVRNYSQAWWEPLFSHPFPDRRSFRVAEILVPNPGSPGAAQGQAKLQWPPPPVEGNQEGPRTRGPRRNAVSLVAARSIPKWPRSRAARSILGLLAGRSQQPFRFRHTELIGTKSGSWDRSIACSRICLCAGTSYDQALAMLGRQGHNLRDRGVNDAKNTPGRSNAICLRLAR